MTEILCHECGHDIDRHIRPRITGVSDQRCTRPECACPVAPSDIAHALLSAEPTEAEVEAAAAAIYAELSGRYGDFNWPGDAARAALKWAAGARR